jgi:hypothetical protein
MRSSFARRIVSGSLIVLMAACGGGGNPAAPTPGASTPTQTVRTVLGNADFTLRANSATFKSIDNAPVGMMDATLEWGNAANQVDFFATDGRCPGFPDLQAGRCTVLARAEGAEKPKRLSFSNTTANGVHNFWIYNRGSSTESGAMEVAVTTTGPINQPPVTVGSPTPNPTTPSDPRAGLPLGPVTQARVAIRSIDTGGFSYRDPQQDADGNWLVHPGEFVVFDLSQRNGAGEKCQWLDDPKWFVKDDSGVLNLRNSSQPFLLRADVARKGYFEVRARIDGIDSNVLSLNSVAHGS